MPLSRLPLTARLLVHLLAVAGLFASATAGAAVIHDEAFDGDLSDHPLVPTALGTLAAGTSTVAGRLANNFENGTEDPADVFSVVVDAGSRLSAISLNLDQGLYFSGANIFLLAGVGSGPGSTILGSFNTRDSGIADGGALFATAGFGIAGPLEAGTYTIDLRGFGSNFGLSSYAFNLTVDPATQHNVPEPATGLLVAGSLLALAASRRRRPA